MRITHRTGWGRGRAPILLLSAALLGGCASDATVATPVDPGPQQPAVAVYDCGEDGSLTVAMAGDRVQVTDAEGTTLELPASPPDQRNRFGEGVNAIVLEGREALYMRGRQAPVACRR